MPFIIMGESFSHEEIHELSLVFGQHPRLLRTEFVISVGRSRRITGSSKNSKSG